LKKDGALCSGALSAVGFEYYDVENLYDDLNVTANDLGNSFIG